MRRESWSLTHAHSCEGPSSYGVVVLSAFGVQVLWGRLADVVSWLREHIGFSAWVVFIGAVTSAAGALLAFLSETTDIHLPVSLVVVVVITGAFVSAAGALVSSGERANHEREIARVSKESLYSITGGDSFCYVLAAGQGWVVIQEGDYPVYDVSVRVVYLRDFQREVAAGAINPLGPHTTNLTVGNLRPGGSVIMGNRKPQDDVKQGYNAFISARNGLFSEELRMVRNSSYAVRVKRALPLPNESPVLYEYVQEGFPTTDKGEVEWGSSEWG